MTDFTVSPSQAFAYENLDWDYTPHNGGFVSGGTLAVSALNAGQHFPDGYVKSGLVLARRTADNLLVPYLAGGAGGAETAVGVLRASVPVTRNGIAKAKVGVALLVHGIVRVSKLPYTSANAAAGGFLDAAGRADLPLIHWEA